MESPISKSIVFSYLAGNATPIEVQLVEEWIKNPDHYDQFCFLLLEWERKHTLLTPDPEQALRRFRSRLTGQVAEPVSDPQPNPRPRLPYTRWLTVAACLALVLAAGWLFRHDVVYKTVRTPFGVVSNHVLPDGSQVTLNANSSLRFPRFGFGEAVREVWLEGEAEFSVVHTATDQRFVVKTPKNLQIEVLGTEFSVFARPRGSKVVLNSGKIRVDYQKEGRTEQLTMSPGDLLTVDQAGAIELETTEKPTDHSAWKERRFVFDATPVSEICQLLEENFGLVVRPANRELAERTISGNFETHTSEELLEILREVFELETSRRHDTLVLHQRQDPTTFN